MSDIIFQFVVVRLVNSISNGEKVCDTYEEAVEYIEQLADNGQYEIQKRWTVAKPAETVDVAELQTLTLEKSRDIFEKSAQRNMGMTGDSFLRMYDAGFWRDKPENPKVERVAMLIPLVRR